MSEQLDPRLVFLALAHARHLLVEAGEMSLDEAFEDCRWPAWDSDTFAAACRRADERQRKKPRDLHLERLRALLDDDVTLERAYWQLQAHLERQDAAAARGTHPPKDPEWHHGYRPAKVVRR